jgi:hypothetical protein
MALSTRLKTLLLSALGLPDMRDELVTAIDATPSGPTTSTSGNVAIWSGTTGRVLADSTITATSGNLVVPGTAAITGNTTVTGTLAVTSTTTSTGDLATAGNFSLTAVGKGIKVKEGANATMGVAVLVGGTVDIATTKVTANSRIFLTAQTNAGTPGFLGVTARVASTSFTITSSSGSDTSSVAWLIVEPS